MSTTLYRGVTYVVPCGGRKADRPAPARDLYTGSMFRHTLSNVERLVAADEAEGLGPARVLIMSAKHGLVYPDWVLEPYEQRIDQPGAISAEKLALQAWLLGIGWDEERERGSEVYALLPRPYLARLDEALRRLGVYVQDVYEGACGIGEQKRVNAHVGRAGAAPATVPDGPGPMVWLGADVSGFWWGVPILVSYGRLREAKTLPVATAPWVCDSRGYSEIADHGTWTIPAEQYARDLDRYADEIGHLQWAAPQDWPAHPRLLARTGLSEEEHQRRTIASVVQLRRLTRVPIVPVVTGATAAGYLRHVAMYAQAGIDLRAERLVGVGALMGRPVQEAAEIVSLLYAAGLTRLHGFGVKGRLLDLSGPWWESVDSAAWSANARRRTGRCPHGLVEWEANCPRAALDWGVRQRRRAARTAVQEALPLFDQLTGHFPDNLVTRSVTRLSSWGRPGVAATPELQPDPGRI